ncbi:MAG: hypothetical protein JXN59_02760 [Anaerolineae bacterium]|nr:hypothetical protein [Anaerolineae bacterium]
MKVLFGIFVVLHGLVHLWYVVLARRLVEFKPEMGWSGQSWLFTSLLGDPAARWLATVAYVLAAVVMALSGIGVLMGAGWWRSLLIGAAAFSTVVILLFWDGGMDHIVEKGLLGLLINVALLVALLGFNWPPETF